MKAGDLVNYGGELHIVVEIRPSIPVARAGLEVVVLHHAKTMKQLTIPMKWLRR